MSEQEFVKHCLNDICKKNGFDDCSSMSHRDFELISRTIEENTGTLISVSTVKRLLNGDFNRMPQTATLNAISSYLGFKNWQEYKGSINNYAKSLNGVQEKILEIPPKKIPNFNFLRKNKKWVGAFVIIMSGILVFSLISFLFKPSPNYEKATFSAEKTTANSIPNTVVFHYNIDDIKADSFFIQQSWDKTKRVRIYKNNYTLTDIYYEPGYHAAKLIANDSIIRTFGVSIPTDKWVFYAKDKGIRGLPEYIKSKNAIENGVLMLDKATLDGNLINTETERSFIYSYFPTKINVSSDGFTLKAKVRMKEIRNNTCPYIVCEVFCQKRFIFFKSTPKGCASEAIAWLGDNYSDGKNVDLSPLSIDVTQWVDVELIVKNNQATVFYNNKEVFSEKHEGSKGLITGLGFISNGLCEIDFVELKGLNGEVVYQNDF